MKAFKKWWSHISYLHKPYEIYDHKRGWKAALEWAQSRLEFGSKAAYSTDDILTAIKKEIKEELEE